MTNQSGFLAILDVGHGNSAVLVDDDYVVVIDAGPKNGLLSFLVEQKIYRIDVLLLSHADADHIGGLIGILASGQFKVGEIRINSDSLKKSRTWESLIYELDQLSRHGKVDFAPSLTPNDSQRYLGPNTRVQILAPSAYLATMGAGGRDRHGRTLETNSISAVIRVLAYDQPLAIFTGDIDDIGLDNLIDASVDATAPILIFPHHGGRLGRSTDISDFVAKLCDAVKPKQVVFSISRDRTNLQPEVIAAMRRSIQGIWIACTQLAKQCAVTLPSHQPTHLNSMFSVGKEYRRCCSGTIVVRFLPPNSVSPVRATHEQFIETSAPKALCRRESS
jgi:competence protein ComEC